MARGGGDGITQADVYKAYKFRHRRIAQTSAGPDSRCAISAGFAARPDRPSSVMCRAPPCVIQPANSSPRPPVPPVMRYRLRPSNSSVCR